MKGFQSANWHGERADICACILVAKTISYSSLTYTHTFIELIGACSKVAIQTVISIFCMSVPVH